MLGMSRSHKIMTKRHECFFLVEFEKNIIRHEMHTRAHSIWKCNVEEWALHCKNCIER